MRVAISLMVIAFSTLALAAGYFSGRSSVSAPRTTNAHFSAPVEVRMPIPAAISRSLHGAHSFSTEDLQPGIDEHAVLSHQASSGRLGESATVALVIMNAGRSLKLESGFIDLPVPVTILIDPQADEAKAVAQAANAEGKIVYAELAIAPGEDAKRLKAELAAVRAALPAIAGIAVHFEGADQSKDVGNLAGLLRRSGLHVLDMTGIEPTALRVLKKDGIAVRSRDVTIDNRDEPAYVSFMLEQAVQVARGRGAAVIVAHPYPGSLTAIGTLLSRSGRDGVNFTAL
ncbi:MAG: hypothetical protein NVSMB31_15650 [Vulcanimicrobiaceae bacterium]